MKNRPSAWVPTLYFAEALPYVTVMILSGIMYTNMGLSNTELAFYTSWLYLPWVIKPLWSPIVDSMRTKRWWILTMQVLIGGALGGVALTLNTALWFKLSLAFFWLMAFSSATHDIAADGFYILGLDEKQQALYVGIRSTFYRVGTIFCQGLLVMLAGWLEQRGSIPMAWSITMLLLGGIMVVLAGFHSLLLPKVERPETTSVTELNLLKSFGDTLRAFFSKPGIVPALCFMLLFRFPEAQLGKMAQPFMLRAYDEGGLALSTTSVGFIYGTIGVIGLLGGGILGGYLVSRHGLKRWIWPMVAAISLPDLVYIYFAWAQPTNLWLINAGVAIEQLGYGFGFTAYMLFLVYFSKGEKSTSVFSICTAIQALGMMIPGLFAGYLADEWGFTNFFIWVCVCTLVTFGVTAFVKIEK